ncbi:MAG: endolytic transglycosylase MltG, partial [Tateyamaria sp.]
MWRHLASNMLTLLMVAMFLLAGIVLWGQSQYRSAGPLTEAICVRVPSGSTMDRVSRDLEAQGAIKSGAIFRIGADYTDKASQLKAGSYMVPAGVSMEGIGDALTKGGAITWATRTVYRNGKNRDLAEVREMEPARNTFCDGAGFNPGTDEVPSAYER